MIPILDALALALFFVCTVGYHNVYYPHRLRSSPMGTAKGKVDLYRRSWIENTLEKGEIITAVQQVRNVTSVATLFASSSLLIIGVIANVFLTKYQLHLEESPVLDIFRIKAYLLISLFGASFMLFLFALRHLNYFSILVGAKKEAVESAEKVGFVDFLTEKINLAMNRYTLGVRCYYYSLAVIAWFFSTYAFIALTLLITLLVALTRDFK